MTAETPSMGPSMTPASSRIGRIRTRGLARPNTAAEGPSTRLRLVLCPYQHLCGVRTAKECVGDVFVLEPHRGRGLGIWLVETILSHPELSAVRFVLGTDDAHGLYERFGFRPLDAARWMERGRSHVPADRNV